MTVANAKPDQIVRGPLGTATVNAASSAWWDVSTVEAKITEAIAYAASIGAKYCFVPDCFLPYVASQVTFNNAVIMQCEAGGIAPNTFDARAYGADGQSAAGGGLDSTAAINAAINACSNFQGGGFVLLSSGNIKLSAPINLKMNVILRGAGQAQAGNASTLLWPTSGAAAVVWSGTFASLNIGLFDFTIDGLGVAGAVGNGINFTNGTNVTIQRVTVQNGPAASVGILFNNVEDSTIQDSSLLTMPTGISLTTSSTNNLILRNIFTPTASGVGIAIDATSVQVIIEGNDIECASLASTIGIKLTAARLITIIGNFIEFATTAAIQIGVSSVDITLIGNALNATNAATACVTGSSVGFITAINNEFQNVGLALNTTICMNIGAGVRAGFYQGNRISGGGSGTMLQLGDGTVIPGTDLYIPDQRVYVLTDAATVAVPAAASHAFSVTLNIAGATRAMGAPSNPQNGQRIHFTIIQDGTGGRAVTWNAVYKVTWSDTGNTLNKRSTIAFIYDGTSWNQDGAQTPYV